jgi:hypothetical protein
VGPMRVACAALSDEGLENAEAEKLLLVLTRVASLPLPLLDRLTAISDILNQRGYVTVTIGRDGYSIGERPQ